MHLVDREAAELDPLDARLEVNRLVEGRVEDVPRVRDAGDADRDREDEQGLGSR
jgi:hypothetical protein